MSTQLIKPNYLVIFPPTQHHSFFRNLPPLFSEVVRLEWSNACTTAVLLKTTCLRLITRLFLVTTVAFQQPVKNDDCGNVSHLTTVPWGTYNFTQWQNRNYDLISNILRGDVWSQVLDGLEVCMHEGNSPWGILTSSVIYHWADARQHGMYLLSIIKKPKKLMTLSVYVSVLQEITDK